MDNSNRRDFIKKSAIALAGVSISTSALSYSRIIGANNRVNIGVVGIRSRGLALLGAIQNYPEAEITHLCDVDSNVLNERKEGLKAYSSRIKTMKDFRKMIEAKDIDAVAIAAPDHTHSPFAIYSLQANKHVYVEKPVSHNPYEGELLVAAQKKYNKVVQVGNQQRSALTSQTAIADIKNGIIGEPYHAFCWYSANRAAIGTGKPAPIPEWLDWDLWQGPAPRKPYMDNIVHYNWHWFKHWGTGEVHNNGFHEIDVCRWALNVNYPTQVFSSGGRFSFQDDWEFFDSQDVTLSFPGKKTIQWKGYSCTNVPIYNRGRGSIIYGTKGSILLDRNIYQVFDMKNILVKEMKEEQSSGTVDVIGDGPLVIAHMKNFLDSVRNGSKLNSPVAEINTSGLLCHFGNMAQFEGKVIEVNPETGACSEELKKKYWKRNYEPGWEPKV
jgi:predicted dehydrogenase